MMHIFQFRDPTPIEALVIATDQDAATAIFENYVRACDGDPDTLLWRELSMEHLEDLAAAAVREALDLRRAGLVTCDAHGCWAFITPIGEPPGSCT